MRNPDQGLNLRAEMAKAAALIRSTAEGQSRQTDRSKWSRVMRYAAAYKPDWEPLDQFISGINACAAQFSRRLGKAFRQWNGRLLGAGGWAAANPRGNVASPRRMPDRHNPHWSGFTGCKDMPAKRSFIPFHSRLVPCNIRARANSNAGTKTPANRRVKSL
jgi:hypothetical protein